MKICAYPSAIALFLLSVGTATGQAPSGPGSIEGLLDARGRAYVEAREALLDRQDIVDVARAALRATTYGPSTWRRLVLTEALIMHVTHREEAERLQNLQGVDSDHYLLRRVPAPSAARELRGLTHVAPLLIELFLKGMESYRWSGPATAQTEEEALSRDLLLAIGRSGHPASVHLLAGVLEGGCACCESCDATVAALGDTGAEEALPLLLDLLYEARVNGDAARRAAVVAALGSIRRAETWPYIQTELDSVDPRVRAAAARSAAAYGSRWYWRSDPGQGARIRAVVGSALVDVLSETEDEEVVLAVLESLGSVATPQLREVLERTQATPGATLRAADPRTSPAVAGDRFRRALDRIDRSLARRQNRADGVRQRP